MVRSDLWSHVLMYLLNFPHVHHLDFPTLCPTCSCCIKTFLKLWDGYLSRGCCWNFWRYFQKLGFLDTCFWSWMFGSSSSCSFSCSYSCPNPRLLALLWAGPSLMLAVPEVSVVLFYVLSMLTRDLVSMSILRGRESKLAFHSNSCLGSCK